MTTARRPSKPPQKYNPKPAPPSYCPFCEFTGKGTAELQKHLDDAHPGWSARYIKKIIQNRAWH